ncbi:MAG: hypothetical protein IT280_09635 [Ignavibacteria bacterium]|nr:hypothetical protein [Ignavibacteria bacterium]
MKASDDLFQLIKSMSKSEKGYFKKFAAKHTIGKKNIYVKLFDAIDSFTEYNEAAIKAKFKGEKFINKLYSTKNYLFNLLLKSLSSYHSDKFSVSKLHMMMIELNVLFEKGLYKQFKSLLKKSISIAKDNDKPFFLAHLYNKALTALVTDYYENSNVFDYKSLKETALLNLETISINEQYHVIYNDMFMFSKETGTLRNENDLNRLNEIINNPLMQNSSLAKTFDAKFRYYTILGYYYRLTGDNKNWLKQRYELVKLMESEKKFIKENPRSYVMALNNYLDACIHSGNMDEFLILIEKLKKFTAQFENKKEYIDLHIRSFQMISDLEMIYAIKISDEGKIREIIENIENGFKKYKEKIPENRKLTIYNRIAFACFIIKDYDRSIFYLNKILNVKNKNIEPKQQIFARIRSLIVNFEAGNYELLEYNLRTTKRYLEKHKRIYKFEKLILDFISKALNYSMDSERIMLYEKLKNDINKISTDKFEQNFLKEFDFSAWLESKIQKTDILNILRQRTI